MAKLVHWWLLTMSAKAFENKSAWGKKLRTYLSSWSFGGDHDVIMYCIPKFVTIDSTRGVFVKFSAPKIAPRPSAWSILHTEKKETYYRFRKQIVFIIFKDKDKLPSWSDVITGFLKEYPDCQFPVLLSSADYKKCTPSYFFTTSSLTWNSSVFCKWLAQCSCFLIYYL